VCYDLHMPPVAAGRSKTPGILILLCIVLPAVLRVVEAGFPGQVNLPISCGGVAVHPGDVLVGDGDGVVGEDERL